MEVILLEKVDKLGKIGDLVKVKDGFARNYLLPLKKALRKNEENMKFFETQKKQIEDNNHKKVAEAQKLAEKVKGLSIIVIRQAGESGHLFGSVVARDIAEAVTEAGCAITKNQVQIDTPIKLLGLYDIKVKLHPEVVILIKANVARTVEEAKIQEASGKALLKAEEAKQDEARALAEAEAAALAGTESVEA